MLTAKNWVATILVIVARSIQKPANHINTKNVALLMLPIILRNNEILYLLAKSVSRLEKIDMFCYNVPQL